MAAVIGLAGAVYGVGPTSILPVAAFVAAAIYLADVRPKVRSFPKNRSGSQLGSLRPLVDDQDAQTISSVTGAATSRAAARQTAMTATAGSGRSG